MPSIFSMNNNYNIDNRRVSSNVTFNQGDKFNGRIVSRGSSNDVLIKTSDGLQFSAEIEGDKFIDENGVFRFEVDGIENGKLKLKIINSNIETSNSSSIDINKNDSFNKEDNYLLNMMVKHNIPLTKDKITFIKSIIQFNDKIKGNEDEISKFIEKFISGKGININTDDGQKINKLLTNFLTNFKTIGDEEILFFIENNIDINTENIDSYNKLFKGNESIKQYIDKVESMINESVMISDKNIDIQQFNLDKVSELDSNIESVTLNKILENESKESLDNIITNDKKDYEEVNIKDNISNSTDKYSDVNLKKELIMNKVLNFKEISSKDMVKDEIKSKIEDMKSSIKGIIKYTDIKDNSIEKVMNLIKGNLNDFKLLNEISSEYYYLDIPLKLNNTEYQSKLIIKDNRKDGKKIDKNNVKLVVSVKTITLGTIDGYLDIKSNNINVDLKCDENVVKVIDISKERLINSLEQLGLSVNVVVSKKNKEVGLASFSEFFSDNNSRINTVV